MAKLISLDTKHILAWVKENNPKAYVLEGDRLDKTRQPKGDRDCKLGCKRSAMSPPRKPKSKPLRLNRPPRPKGQSRDQLLLQRCLLLGLRPGVVATKVPDWGEFVLAELTQTFDKNDVTYFFP
ncbi:MAG: hypothetical protein HS114_22755 [Anaerolineales bacterium]|nr:hypothetical protein [Anaerolineales bacterium]